MTFEDHVFKAFSQNEQYDKLLHQLKEIRRHLMEHDTFKRMKTKGQYDMCITVALIVTNTVHGQVIRDMPLSRSKEDGGRYDIISRFKAPEMININSQKLLR
jgi:hypothetical protein